MVDAGAAAGEASWCVYTEQMLTLVLNDYYQTLEKSAHFLFFLLQ